MGKTKLRSWDDEIEDLLNNLVKDKIGITFNECLEKVNQFSPSVYKNLGSLEIFIPINKLIIKNINSDTYKWWKKYNGFDDCYYFFIRRIDRQPFFLDLIYLNYQTDMHLITDKDFENYFIEIYGSNHYYDFELMYSVKAYNENINKKFHKFNSKNEYVYYIIRLPLDLINISNLINISLFNTRNDGILYTKDDIVSNN